MNFTPTWQQAELLKLAQMETWPTDGYKRKQRIAVKSGQGTGKTTTGAIIGLWRSLMDQGAVVVVTAPSMRQCRDVFLMEASRALDKADPLLKRLINITRTKVKICDRNDWGIWTVTAKDPEAAQGYHQEWLTFIIEEASGVEREFIEQIKGTLSNPNALMIQIGNPNTNDCAFHDCFGTHAHMYSTLTFDAEDTARDYPHILSPQRNSLIAEEYGVDSDVYRVRVKGQFPFADPNTIIALGHLEDCTKLKMHELAVHNRRRGGILELPRQFGIDLARFGSDESVIAQRLGNAIVKIEAYSKREPIEVFERAMRIQRDSRWRDMETLYVADAGGMGQGAMATLIRAGRRVHEFHNNGRPLDTTHYENKITEAYFTFSDYVRRKAFYVPRDHRLVQQLSTRFYFTTKKGKLVVESKDDYMKRGFDSPDRADAVVMAAYDQTAIPAKFSFEDEAIPRS